MTRTLVTLKSGNSKIGPLAQTTREQSSCPTTCPLFSNGCYARGRIFTQATKWGREELDQVRALSKTLPPGRGLRLNVAGDFLSEDGTPDVEYISACNAVAEERPDVMIIAYTHAWRTLTPNMFRFGVNASCETDAEIEEARAMGWGTVTINAEPGAMVAGTRIVRCPAETRDDVTCATCMLCAKTPKINTTVTFTAHGAGKAKATKVINAKRS